MEIGNYVLGVDIGSTTSKCIILEDGQRVVGQSVVVAGTGTKGPEQAVEEALKEANLSSEDISFTLATGYGRNGYEGADAVMSGLSCHTRGTRQLFPNVKTIIDIGGQDAKVMSVNDKGQMTNFLMNDKCAAGTGRFLDVMATILQLDINDLEKEAAKSEKPTRTLKSGIIAGSSFTAKEYLAICEYLGMPYLQPSYGQTETAPCVTISDYDDSLEEKANSVGHVIEHVTVDIRNDSGNAAEPGEIWVKGYNVMNNGYYKMDLKVKDDNNWLETGDTGYFDTKGDLHIIGRTSDMIIRGGENISPLEIEVVVKNHPDILEAKAFGVPDPILQEQVALAIVMKKNCPYDEEVVKNYLKGKIANYKIPFYYLHLEEMPRNTTGKINVNALVERFNMENSDKG